MSRAGMWVVGLLGVSAIVHGCATTTHGAVSSSSARSAGWDGQAQASLTQQLPAGTTFAAVLRRGLDSQHDSAGQPFTARLTDEVRTADGAVAIPAGAMLYGHVAQTPGYRGPVPVLRIDAVGTAAGRWAIRATAAPAQQRSYGPWTASRFGRQRGGGPGLLDLQPAEASHWLPAGTLLRVSLAQPLAVASAARR